MNTVSANLTDFDRQTVFSLRTCTCVCGPGLLALVEEVEVPFHQLNLIELAALNQAPLRCPCPTCGCETVAQYRASVMIPAESELPALAHVVIGDSEPQYALLARGELAGPAWTSVIASLHDPESWQPVDPDEEWLAEYWGRPLSTMALLRVRFAYCLDVEQEPCLLSTTEGVKYLLANVEADAAGESSVAILESAFSCFGPQSAIPSFIRKAVGQAGSVAACLGPYRADLDRVGLLGLADASVLERYVRQALADAGLDCVADDSGSDQEWVLRVQLDGMTAELDLVEVAIRSLDYGLTPAEAAAVETKRLILKLDAFRSAERAFAEALGDRGTITQTAAGHLDIVLADGAGNAHANLASLLPKESWNLTVELAKGHLDHVFGAAKRCSCGRSIPLAHLRPSGFSSEDIDKKATTITDDLGHEFELVASLDCDHIVCWPPAEHAPSDADLERGLEHASFRAVAETVAFGDGPAAVLVSGESIATMLAHPALAHRLARKLAEKLHTPTLFALAVTTHTIVLASDDEALELGHAELINHYPQGLPGLPLYFAKQISIHGPASGSLNLRWLSSPGTTESVAAAAA
jgi:hypothetical protein